MASNMLCKMHKPASHLLKRTQPTSAPYTYKPCTISHHILAFRYSTSNQQKPSMTGTSKRRTPPPNSWDSHLHVLPPTDLFPLGQKAVYAPSHIAPLSDALKLAQDTHVPNQVFTQVSIYGDDNSAQLSAANSLPPGSRGRVVISMDPASATEVDLDQWHAQGVRGVRLNLKSVESELSGAQFVAQLRQIINRIKQLGWALQLHIKMALVPELAPLIEENEINIVLDHFAGLPRPFTKDTDLEQLKGWKELLGFMDGSERVFVKLSAPYRIVAPDDASYSALEEPFKLLCGCREGRGVMYASDWPHTRFEDTADVSLWLDRSLEWCEGDKKLEERLFRDNSERVWS